MGMGERLIDDEHHYQADQSEAEFKEEILRTMRIVRALHSAKAGMATEEDWKLIEMARQLEDDKNRDIK